MECVKIKENKSLTYKGKCQDTRYLPLEKGKRNEIYYAMTNHCMNNIGKSFFCIVYRNKACVSNELANLIYYKVEKNQACRIETIKQELWNYANQRRRDNI